MTIPVNELKNGVVFQDSTGVWQVETFHHVKMGRGNAVIKVKVRNLRNGTITEKSFISGNKVELAETSKKKVQYLYSDEASHFFMDLTSFDQLILPVKSANDLTLFIKEGENVDLLEVLGEPASVDFPRTVVLKVAEADPGERGNSASNFLKSCHTETGLEVQVPLFIKVGDSIKVDTRSSSYIERAS